MIMESISCRDLFLRQILIEFCKMLLISQIIRAGGSLYFENTKAKLAGRFMNNAG